MRLYRMLSLGCCALPLFTVCAAAQSVTYEEEGGVTYQVTRRKVARPITEIQTETREQTIYRDKYSTEFQQSERRYLAPITEYRWEPQWVNPWNPFASSYVAYRWVPVTRWVEKTETVRIPITRREVVPEKITTNVPVMRQRFVEDEYVSRVAVSANPGASSSSATSVASRNTVGSVQKLDNDPPREGDWRPAATIRR